MYRVKKERKKHDSILKKSEITNLHGLIVFLSDIQTPSPHPLPHPQTYTQTQTQKQFQTGSQWLALDYFLFLVQPAWGFFLLLFFKTTFTVAVFLSFCNHRHSHVAQAQCQPNCVCVFLNKENRSSSSVLAKSPLLLPVLMLNM